MNTMPHSELVWGEVYFPRFIGYRFGLRINNGHRVTRNKFGLHKFVAFPAVEICLVVLFTGVIGLFIPIL